MAQNKCVSVDDLRSRVDLHGCTLRMINLDDVQSENNPDGVILPQPTLCRSTHVHELTYGEQSLEQNVPYTFCGTDGRTVMLINQTSNTAMQLYYEDLQGIFFIVVHNQI